MENDPPFATLLQAVRDGSADAARQLFEHYRPHVLRAVRRQLNKRLRARFDSFDFTQEVWASFFAIPPDQLTFDRPESLVAFLANVARHKVIEVFRQQLQTQKYDLNREQPLDAAATAEPAGAEPTPMDTAVANEQWERLLAGQTPQRQRILIMLRQGASCREIAAELGLSERTVRRVLEKLAPRLVP